MTNQTVKISCQPGDIIHIDEHTSITIGDATKGDGYGPEQRFKVRNSLLVLRDALLTKIEKKGESLNDVFYGKAGRSATIPMDMKPDRFFVIRDAEQEKCRVTFVNWNDDGIEVSISGQDADTVTHNGVLILPSTGGGVCSFKGTTISNGMGDGSEPILAA